MRNLKRSPIGDVERSLIAEADNVDAWEPPVSVAPSKSPRPEWYTQESAVGADQFAETSEYLKSVRQILSESGSNNMQSIMSPVTEERLSRRGISIAKSPNLTLEQSIDLMFAETRKQRAIETAKGLPPSPDIPVPSIQSLYYEIRQAIILGLNGAAITLCGILVEYALKYAAYKVEMSGFAKYDPDKADEFERLTLGPAIDRAAKAGLIKADDVHKLREFKDQYRNPYNHYNLKKITSNYRINDVRIVNTKTGETERRAIDAKDDPVIQAQAKPIADRDNVLDVFIFADSVVKVLWIRLNQVLHRNVVNSDWPE
jgi:hypothetical protein